MSDPTAIYTWEWFEHDFAGLQDEFTLAARGIDRWAHARFETVTALDVGCGPGMLVAGLRDAGWNAHGFDGSSHALTYALRHVPGAYGHIAQCNIEDFNPGMAFSTAGLGVEEFDEWEAHADVVVCTEVAEHLEEALAPELVRKLTQSAFEAIVFTAAPPGQGGHHHVNCRPQDYWLELFADWGWILDDEGTRELRQRWWKLRRLSHMTRNLMVLR